MYALRNGILLFALFVGHCTPRSTTVMPAHFKVRMPFLIDREGIALTTYWGDNNNPVSIHWDNHSPTWANNALLMNNKAIRLSSDFLFRTTTADGKRVQGEVFDCDSLLFGDVRFHNVQVYHLEKKARSDSRQRFNGVMGSNLIEKGVWKIDFLHKQITFSSSVDSLSNLWMTQEIPAIFTSQGIQLTVVFPNGLAHKVEIDLGFNGGILVPSAAYQSITKSVARGFSDRRKLFLPSGNPLQVLSHRMEKVIIGNEQKNIILTSTEQIQEWLLGLEYFTQYDYIVMDFLNKKLYLPQTPAYNQMEEWQHQYSF